MNQCEWKDKAQSSESQQKRSMHSTDREVAGRVKRTPKKNEPGPVARLDGALTRPDDDTQRVVANGVIRHLPQETRLCSHPEHVTGCPTSVLPKNKVNYTKV